MNCKYSIKGNRLHLYTTCDGTLMFLEEMYRYLVLNGFQDVRYSNSVVSVDHKPWIRTLFECSGDFVDSKLKKELEEHLKINDVLRI